MSILIKDMGMPADGNETIIRIQPDGTILDQYGHHLGIAAVSIPPHGRLINADELIKHKWDAGTRCEFAKVVMEADQQVVDIGAIIDAPTIIEADQEKI